jgi:subtilisin family serine protease
MVNTTNDPLLSDPNFPGAIHGWNFYDDNNDPMDYYGHGTGRAGLAAARANNGVGMAGASPRSLIMAIKVGDTYVVHSENVAQGVVYAADHGADVINTSLGSTGNSRLQRAAATYRRQGTQDHRLVQRPDPGRRGHERRQRVPDSARLPADAVGLDDR